MEVKGEDKFLLRAKTAPTAGKSELSAEYLGASHFCKYRCNWGKIVTLVTRAARATTMNSEDSQRLEACLQQAAEILYRNTSTEELTSFESLEKAVRTKMLELVSPKIAFFLSNKLQEQKKAENE
jgi:hypothetical protein